MFLTLNEMQALAEIIGLALADKDLTARIDDHKNLSDRWEIIKNELKELGGGIEYVGNVWRFNDEETAKAVSLRLQDLIGEEKEKKRNARRQSLAGYAAFLSALASLVSAACALCSVLH